MVQRAVIASVAAIAAFSSHASAAPEGRARVAVDWSGVTDSDVARCGLSRLRAGTIERPAAAGQAGAGPAASGRPAGGLPPLAGGWRTGAKAHAATRKEKLNFPKPATAPSCWT